jgi:4-hydroxybenzoate polyprenyltransferase
MERFKTIVKKVFRTLKWYLQLVRWPNLLIIAFSQYFVRYNLISSIYDYHNNCTLAMGHLDFALLVMSTLLIVAGGYIINDYFDIRIDVVNRPEKVLLFHHIRLRSAIHVYYALTVIGCLLGIYVAFMIGSFKLGFVSVIMSIVLWYYSLKYKRIRFAGNFAVAVLVAMSIAMIWLFEFFALQQNANVFSDMLPYFSQINIYIMGYSVFAFMITLIREMIKDIEDIEGDKSFRCHTLPIVYGIPRMKNAIILITILTVGMTAFATHRLFIVDKPLAGWYFAIVIGLLLLYFLILLFKAKERKDYHFLSNILKIIMVAGILSMQLVSLRS